jgi:ribosomal protein S18 acetylase RimI-like enzyme
MLLDEHLERLPIAGPGTVDEVQRDFPPSAYAYRTPTRVKVFGSRLRPMHLPSDLRLRDATSEDVPAIGALRESVGWGVTGWALRAVIGQGHAACLLAVDGGGNVAGVGSGIVYGPMGFIGNMIVAEPHRRRGVASAILEAVTAFLEGAGCTRLELNATSDGRPLYERHGFRSRGRSATARIPRDAELGGDPGVRVREASDSDLPVIAAYDRPRFGGDRRVLLELLLHEPTAAALVAAGHFGINGYAFVRTDDARIGPMVADAPSTAGALLRVGFELLPDARDVRLNLPPNNRPGAAWLESIGVELEPWDGRMGRGPDVPRRDDTVYGMTIGALG